MAAVAAGYRKGLVSAGSMACSSAFLYKRAWYMVFSPCRDPISGWPVAAVAAGYRKGLVSAGWPVLLLSCTNEHRKRPFHLVGTPFLEGPWRLLQLAVERAWSALDGPFFCFLVQTSIENGPFTL